MRSRSHDNPQAITTWSGSTLNFFKRKYVALKDFIHAPTPAPAAIPVGPFKLEAMIAKASIPLATQGLTQQEIILSACKNLVELLQYRHEHYRAFWRSRPKNAYQNAEATTDPIKTIINNLADYIQQTHQLNDTELQYLKAALWKFEWGMSHTTDRGWDVEIEDLYMVCGKPRFAKKMVTILVWLHENHLFVESNRCELCQCDWLENVDQHNLTRLRIREFNEGKENYKVPKEILQFLFLGLMQDRSAIEAQHSHAIVPQNSKKFESCFVMTHLDHNNYLKHLCDKTITIPLNVFLSIKDIFFTMHEQDKERVLERLVFALPDMSAANPFEGFPFQEVDNQVTLNLPQIFFLTCILCAAAVPFQKTYFFLGGPPAGWKMPKLTADEVEQNALTAENKNLAIQLRITLLGQTRAEALRPLWQCAMTEPNVFSFATIAPLFLDIANDFVTDYASIVEMFRNIEISPSLAEDMRYIKHYFDTHQSVLPANTEIMVTDSHRHESFDSYSASPKFTHYDRPALNLAAGLLWLHENGLDTLSNKEKIFQRLEHISALTSIKIDNYNNTATQEYRQKIFDLVMGGIDHLLKFKKQMVSPKDCNKVGFFSKGPLQAVTVVDGNDRPATLHR